MKFETQGKQCFAESPDEAAEFLLCQRWHIRIKCVKKTAFTCQSLQPENVINLQNITERDKCKFINVDMNG